MKQSIVIFLLAFSISSFSFADELWINSSGNDRNKFSPLQDINVENVNTLEKAWVMHAGYIPKDSTNNQATPIFVDGVLVTKSMDGKLLGINPSNGEKVWITKIPAPFSIRGYSYNEGSIYVPTKNGIIAIEATSGKVNKRVGINGFFGNSFSALAPVFDTENVITANFNGTIESYKRKTGELNWTTSLYKDKVSPRIWSGLTIDRELNIVFVVTSNSNGLLTNGSIDGGYSCSLIAIDARNGNIKWTFKEIINDVWDLDVVGVPLVINVNNTKIKAVIAVTKQGNTIYLNALNGEPIFKDSIKKIAVSTKSDIANQRLSPTQIEILRPERFSDVAVSIADFNKNSKSAQDFVNFKINNAKFEKFTPVSLRHNVVMYGLHGGASWPGAAFDKKNNSVIIPSNKVPWILRAQYRLTDNTSFPKHLVTQFYREKCATCHGNKLEGRYLTEIDGDDFFPSLLGISSTRDSAKIIDLNEFKYKHKYINPTHLNDQRISQVYKLMGLNLENRWKLKLHKVIGNKLSVLIGLFPSIEDVSLSLNNLNQQDLIDLSVMYRKIDEYAFSNNMLEIDAFWQLLLDENLMPINNPPWGHLTSINLSSGAINWKIPFGYTPYKGQAGDMNFGGVLTTGSGIIFATGTRDNYASAYDAKTGVKLWESLMPAAGSSPPMTYKYKNCQYVVFNASGGRWLGYSKASDLLIAYKLAGCKIEQ